MSECNDRCDWTPWAGHVHIKDMLGRRCRTCGKTQMRTLPPDIPKRAPDEDWRDLTWGEEGPGWPAE